MLRAWVIVLPLLLWYELSGFLPAWVYFFPYVYILALLIARADRPVTLDWLKPMRFDSDGMPIEHQATVAAKKRIAARRFLSGPTAVEWVALAVFVCMGVLALVAR